MGNPLHSRPPKCALLRWEETSHYQGRPLDLTVHMVPSPVQNRTDDAQVNQGTDRSDTPDLMTTRAWDRFNRLCRTDMYSTYSNKLLPNAIALLTTSLYTELPKLRSDLLWLPFPLPLPSPEAFQCKRAGLWILPATLNYN